MAKSLFVKAEELQELLGISRSESYRITLDELKNEISVAVTNRGRITVTTYDLYKDENGYYFEQGCEFTKININDFKEIKE